MLFNCLYDQQCVDPNHRFQPRNISSFSLNRFLINVSVELIVNQLFVEEYSFRNQSQAMEGCTFLIDLSDHCSYHCEAFFEKDLQELLHQTFVERIILFQIKINSYE